MRMSRASRSERDGGNCNEALAPGAELEAAADDVQPLPDAADAQSYRFLQGRALLDRRAAPFVGYLDDGEAPIAPQADVRRIAAGMPVDVGETLLDDGEQRQLNVSRQPAEIHRDEQVGLNAAPLDESGDVPVGGGDEPLLVQQGRVEKVRQRPYLRDRMLGELAGLPEQRQERGVPGVGGLLGPREREADGGQVLRRLVVKLARNPAPLRFLRPDQTAGEEAQRASGALGLGDVQVHHEQVEGPAQVDSRRAQLGPVVRMARAEPRLEAPPRTADHGSDFIGDLGCLGRADAFPEAQVGVADPGEGPGIVRPAPPQPRLVGGKHARRLVEDGDLFRKGVHRTLQRDGRRRLSSPGGQAGCLTTVSRVHRDDQTSATGPSSALIHAASYGPLVRPRISALLYDAATSSKLANACRTIRVVGFESSGIPPPVPSRGSPQRKTPLDGGSGTSDHAVRLIGDRSEGRWTMGQRVLAYVSGRVTLRNISRLTPISSLLPVS